MKRYKVTVDGQSFTVLVEELTADEKPPTKNGTAPNAVVPEHSTVQPAPQPDRETAKPHDDSPSGAADLNIESPMPGSIIKIAVAPGDRVEKGDVLLVLEAMKMENEITAPQSGTVSAVYVQVGETVGSGDPLVGLS